MSGQIFRNGSFSRSVAGKASAFAALSVLGALAGCNSDSGRSMQALSDETQALLAQKGVAASAPMLIRAYKKESELEVWKMRPDGEYVLLKSFPICRWSGQLGPKHREGDRQSPEGFYTITPGQMNPNSAYYLSFNIGYPNAYDRAHGATGGSVMVHGVCSSSGCFSMTDAQIAEIYALARESFNAGQRGIQMQALPFHLTASNLAKYRLDPNMTFWKELKKGADHFEATHHEVSVGVCGGHYVFGVKSANGQPLDAEAPCPALAAAEPQTEALVAQRERTDEAQVAAFVKQGERAVRLVYQDGAQHPVFANRIAEVSRPEALVPPVELALDGGKGAVKARTAPTVVAIKLAQQQARAEAAQTQAREMQARADAQAAAEAQAKARNPVVALTDDSLRASKEKLSAMLAFNSDSTATTTKVDPAPVTVVAATPKAAPAKTALAKTEPAKIAPAKREALKPQPVKLAAAHPAPPKAPAEAEKKLAHVEAAAENR